ncbi:unnamed protein product [Allacma fusca]|uniref:Uncharacterized protein n=1 Tax=Allacma fusca TaxID=39272 RepID=A0A8J2J3F7_9HEXA|nr:unnamed protein product [Allacma fusca]
MTIFNFLFSGLSQGSKQPLKSLSLREIAMVFFTQAGIMAVFSGNVAITVLCSKLHIYHFLPRHLQTPLTFIPLWIHENLFIQSKMVCLSMTTCQFLMFFETITETLTRETLALLCVTRNEFHFRTLLRTCRKIQLLIIVFNSGYAHVVYLMKILPITFAILYGYSSIRYFSNLGAVITAALLVVCFYMIIFYVAIFGRAFCVPQRMQSFKIELVRSTRLRPIGSFEVKYLQKKTASVANVGIKVGMFHTMERESTPIFIDFVVTTVSTMLITYR